MWEKRVAATVIIGSIVEGIQNIKEMIQYTFQRLLNLLSDPVTLVKESAAWSISKICEAHSEFLITSNLFNTLVSEVLKSMQQNPKIATHSC